jgi:hypothetical protein
MNRERVLIGVLVGMLVWARLRVWGLSKRIAWTEYLLDRSAQALTEAKGIVEHHAKVLEFARFLHEHVDIRVDDDGQFLEVSPRYPTPYDDDGYIPERVSKAEPSLPEVVEPLERCASA